MLFPGTWCCSTIAIFMVLLVGLVRNEDNKQGDGTFGCGAYRFSTYEGRSRSRLCIESVKTDFRHPLIRISHNIRACQATWEEARRMCSARGYGDLVAFDSEGEYEYVRNIFKNISTLQSKQGLPYYWISGSTGNGFGVFLWHSSGILLQNTPSIIKYITDVQTFALIYTKCTIQSLYRKPLFLRATVGGQAAPLITYADETRKHYFICEQQTHECRVNTTLNLDSSLLSVTTSEHTGLSESSNSGRQQSKENCYIFSKCKGNYWYSGGSCRRRGYGELLTIDSQEEAQLIAQLLKKTKTREQFWTNGRRIHSVVWENSNTTLSRDDSPPAFDWYFRSKYEEQMLAISTSSTAPGGVEWEFVYHALSLRFICELQTSECQGSASRAAKNHVPPAEVGDMHSPPVTLEPSEGHRKIKRNPRENQLRNLTHPFHLSQFGNRCYIFYNGTIHPEELQSFCRSYKWEGFEMDQPEERNAKGTWTKILDFAQLIFYPDADKYESIPVCTAGVAKTEYKWMPHDSERSDDILPNLSNKLLPFPRRHVYLYQKFTTKQDANMTRVYEHYGWKINSAEEQEIQRCHPVCEISC